MDDALHLTREELREYHRSLSNWGRWGERDQLGTLNLLTPEARAAAAAGVRSGRTVSCARALDTVTSADNPRPALHMMTSTATEGSGGDWFGLAHHGYATSHIDALCHIFAGESLYNGYPVDRVTARGAVELGIHHLRDGIVGRGVLLDVPRALDREYLEAGTAIGPDDLDRAEQACGVEVRSGDLLLVRTGRWRERARRGPWDPHAELAGLHARCLPWLHARGVAALGSDGVSDVVPSRVEGERLPIHATAIPIMGLHLLDNLDLEDLARACREERRCDFLLTIAPLVLEGGTGSPVNPIAVF
ncbi:MAG: cyclase family protein [Myxococcota bacterium]